MNLQEYNLSSYLNKEFKNLWLDVKTVKFYFYKTKASYKDVRFYLDLRQSSFSEE